MYQTRYQIAGISILITAPFKIYDDEAFALYRVAEFDHTEQIYHVNMLEDDQVPKPSGACIFRNELNMVFDQAPALHYFRAPMAPAVCAWDYLENNDRMESTLHFRPSSAAYFHSSTGIFNAIGIERILHAHNKYLFHCSYVDYKGKALLFSAPSGGGKTTQGQLWERYAGATMINGDRSVLEDSDGKIICHGLPIAGSSGVFINRSLPLSGIFVLSKGTENSLQRLTGKDAIHGIFSQLTVNMWNAAFVQNALDFSIALASKVPVYHLTCNISEEAVQIVKKEIEEICL